jgi:ParB family chromosome partitioning protein
METLTIEPLPMAKLFADPAFNCRGFIAPIEVTDLAKSMAEKGLLEPLNVQPIVHPIYDYRLISGHRRHKAAVILGWTTIPCIIRRDLTEEQALALNLIENVQREDLNILQEAKAIERFVKRGVTTADICRHIDQPRGWVDVRIKLLGLPPEIQAEAAAGLLTYQHIRDIASEHSKDAQFEMVRMIKDRALNGQKTPTLKKPQKSLFQKKRRQRDEIFEMIEHIMDTIEPNFGTRCLAWAAGEISDMELFGDIKKMAEDCGLPYRFPAGYATPLSQGVQVGAE